MNTFKRKALYAAVLASLASYLTLGVDPPDGDPDPDPAGDPDPAALLEDDPDPDGDPDPAADGDPDPDADPAAALERERAARTRAEREAGELRTRAEAAERARTAAPQPNPQQDQARQLWEREEAILRDPASSESDKWYVNANRAMRESTARSMNAEQRAMDASDRMEFTALKAENPVAKKYATRVEEKLTELRASGRNIDRKTVLKMLIGDDIVEGRVKAKGRANAGDPGTKVHRGQPPVTRGNVSRGGGGSSERDKRAARLAGRNI